MQAAETDNVPQEAPDENQIEDLIAENLIDSLAILPEIDLANALHEFVDKVSISASCQKDPYSASIWK